MLIIRHVSFNLSFARKILDLINKNLGRFTKFIDSDQREKTLVIWAK